VLFDGLALTGNKRPLRNLPSSRPCRYERATTTHKAIQRKEAQREREKKESPQLPRASRNRKIVLGNRADDVLRNRAGVSKPPESCSREQHAHLESTDAATLESHHATHILGSHEHTRAHSLSLSLLRSLLPSGLPSVSVPFTEHVLCTKRRTTKLPKGFPSQQTPKTTPEKKNKKTDLRQHEVSCDNHDVRRTQWYYNPPPLIPEAAAEETTIKATTKDSDHFVE